MTHIPHLNWYIMNYRAITLCVCMLCFVCAVEKEGKDGRKTNKHTACTGLIFLCYVESRIDFQGEKIVSCICDHKVSLTSA